MLERDANRRDGRRQKDSGKLCHCHSQQWNRVKESQRGLVRQRYTSHKIVKGLIFKHTWERTYKTSMVHSYDLSIDFTRSSAWTLNPAEAPPCIIAKVKIKMSSLPHFLVGPPEYLLPAFTSVTVWLQLSFSSVALNSTNTTNIHQRQRLSIQPPNSRAPKPSGLWCLCWPFLPLGNPLNVRRCTQQVGKVFTSSDLLNMEGFSDSLLLYFHQPGGEVGRRWESRTMLLRSESRQKLSNLRVISALLFYTHLVFKLFSCAICIPKVWLTMHRAK